MAASRMESDPPYGSADKIDSAGVIRDGPPICADVVDLPWWADVIESGELAETIRSQCDEKVQY